MSNKKKYRIFCNQEKTIPLFSQAWWLDAVAENKWDVCLVERNGEIHASMPYVVKKKYGFTHVGQPSLTQHLGPWIRPSDGKYCKQLSHQKEVMNMLIESLPSFDSFTQNFSPAMTNWLPFYWKGFEQRTNYTYRLDITIGKDNLWKNVRDNLRGHIRKARDRFFIEVQDGTFEDFYKLNYLTFKRQKRNPPDSYEFVKNIDDKACELKVRNCLIAVDKDGVHHAGAYIVRSGSVAYYLMGGIHPDFTSSGAMSLVLWEAICRQPSEIKIFDFEGSMVESIEQFFRDFGACQTPYFYLSKTNSKLIKLYHFLKSLNK